MFFFLNFRCLSGFTGPQCNEKVVDDNELKGATLGILIALVIYIPISFICIFILASSITIMRNHLRRQDRNLDT